MRHRSAPAASSPRTPTPPPSLADTSLRRLTPPLASHPPSPLTCCRLRTLGRAARRPLSFSDLLPLHGDVAFCRSLLPPSNPRSRRPPPAFLSDLLPILGDVASPPLPCPAPLGLQEEVSRERRWIHQLPTTLPSTRRPKWLRGRLLAPMPTRVLHECSWRTPMVQWRRRKHVLFMCACLVLHCVIVYAL